MLINVLLLEAILLLGVYGILFALIIYNEHIKKESDGYAMEDEITDKQSINEEVYDLGYLSDMNKFDTRISDMRNELQNVYNEPPVEYISEEYEANMYK